MTSTERARGSHRRSSRALVLVAAVGLVGVSAFGIGAAPVAAAGNPTLGTLILPNPMANWRPASSAAVAAIVDRLQKLDTNAASGETVHVAADLWQSPTSDDILGITLSEWPSNIGNLDGVMRTGLNDECVTVTGNNPSSVSPASDIGGSLAATCAGSSGGGGSELAVVVARKGTYIELVESIGVQTTSLGLGEVEAIAARQFRVLPNPPMNLAAVIGGSVGGVILLGLAVLVATLVRSARRRRRSAAAFAGPGVAVPAGWSGSSWPQWPAQSGAQPPTGTGPAPRSAWPPASGGGPAPSGDEPLAGSTGQAPRGAWPPASGGGPAASGDEPLAGHRGPEGSTAAPFAPRSSTSPADPAPPLDPTPGWRPVGGDPHRQSYWDGTRWTSRIRWDGTAWVQAD